MEGRAATFKRRHTRSRSPPPHLNTIRFRAHVRLWYYFLKISAKACLWSWRWPLFAFGSIAMAFLR